ncbi:FadD3 family acyl-CoA ligase [Nonomuraea bangladeshensis]|uniref:FadD3 family acyl-CoA ligase n=1 Tax=Nonomuraea bangladeshensis TaxID=404385 RepID=UPI003C2F3307
MSVHEHTLPAALDAAARRFGEREAVVDGPVRWSFSQLRERARAFAALLVERGVEPGERVAIWAPNTRHWIQAAYGTLYAGCALVPLNTRFTAEEAADVLRRSRTRALVVAGPFLGRDRRAELDRAALPELHTVVQVPGELTGSVPAPELDARAAAVRPGDVADILFTSGTTGRSKGAMSTHQQALSVAWAWGERVGLTADDRYLVVSPFFHSFGYKAGLLAALLRGVPVLPQAVFDVEQTLSLVAAERVTVLPGAPTIYQTMLDHPGRGEHDLSSLRLAVTGAAPVPVTLVERMRRELTFEHVLTAYGLTEAVVATLCAPGDDPDTVATTSGRAAAGFEIAIVREDGSPCPPGEPGEVLLRGPNVMLGYLDDPQATAQAIDADGWLHTGDVGALNERGYLTLTGRLKEMYICGGFNVYPAEVEQVLARLPGVVEAAVVGVPDPRLGEVGKAYLVGSVREEQVIEHCKRHLANYKVPRHVEMVAELPRNAGGKVVKHLLGGGRG